MLNNATDLKTAPGSTGNPQFKVPRKYGNEGTFLIMVVQTERGRSRRQGTGAYSKLGGTRNVDA